MCCTTLLGVAQAKCKFGCFLGSHLHCQPGGVETSCSRVAYRVILPLNLGVREAFVLPLYVGYLWKVMVFWSVQTFYKREMGEVVLRGGDRRQRGR